jgi:hypothetical protein
LEQRSRYPQSGWRQLEMARVFNLPGDAFESSSTISRKYAVDGVVTGKVEPKHRRNSRI